MSAIVPAISIEILGTSRSGECYVTNSSGIYVGQAGWLTKTGVDSHWIQVTELLDVGFRAAIREPGYPPNTHFSDLLAFTGGSAFFVAEEQVIDGLNPAALAAAKVGCDQTDAPDFLGQKVEAGANMSVLVTGDAGARKVRFISTGGGGGSAAVADWDLDVVRYFAVDVASGSDANVGYIDDDPGAILDFSGKAKQTLEGVLSIIPECGAGRKAALLLAPGTYPGNLDLHSKTGYLDPLVRGSDLTNTPQDKSTLGGVIAVEGPNGDGSWTASGTPSNFLIPTAAGALPTAGFKARGKRVRWTGNVTTALANVSSGVLDNTETVLELCQAPKSDCDYGTPTLPVAGDTFFLESPGVIIQGKFRNWGSVISNVNEWDTMGVGAVFAGIRFEKDYFCSIDFSSAFGTYIFTFCDFASPTDTTNIFAEGRNCQYYFDTFWYDETFLSGSPTGPGMYGAQTGGIGAIFRSVCYLVGRFIYDRATFYLPTNPMVHSITYKATEIYCNQGGFGSYRVHGNAYVGSPFPGEDGSAMNLSILNGISGLPREVRMTRYRGTDRMLFVHYYENDSFRSTGHHHAELNIYGVVFEDIGSPRGVNIDITGIAGVKVNLGVARSGTLPNTYVGATHDIMVSGEGSDIAFIEAGDLAYNNIIDPKGNYINGTYSLALPYVQTVPVIASGDLASPLLPGEVVHAVAGNVAERERALSPTASADADGVFVTTTAAGVMGLMAVCGPATVRFDAAVDNTTSGACYVSTTEGRASTTSSARKIGNKHKLIPSLGTQYATVFLNFSA